MAPAFQVCIAYPVMKIEELYLPLITVEEIRFWSLPLITRRFRWSSSKLQWCMASAFKYLPQAHNHENHPTLSLPAWSTHGFSGHYVSLERD